MSYKEFWRIRWKYKLFLYIKRDIKKAKKKREKYREYLS